MSAFFRPRTYFMCWRFALYKTKNTKESIGMFGIFPVVDFRLRLLINLSDTLLFDLDFDFYFQSYEDANCDHHRIL